jgi:hypothetical protein
MKGTNLDTDEKINPLNKKVVDKHEIDILLGNVQMDQYEEQVYPEYDEEEDVFIDIVEESIWT